MGRAKLGLALATLSLFAPGSIAAEGADRVVVDRIVAVVDQDVVTSAEVARRAAPYMSRLRDQPLAERLTAEASARREMLDKIIDERIIASVAETDRVVVTPAEIDAAMEQVMKANSLTREALDASVHDAGWTDEAYREELRRQLLEGRVVQIKVTPKIRNARSLSPEAYQSALESGRRAFLDEEKSRHFIEVRL